MIETSGTFRLVCKKDLETKEVTYQHLDIHFGICYARFCHGIARSLENGKSKEISQPFGIIQSCVQCCYARTESDRVS